MKRSARTSYPKTERDLSFFLPEISLWEQVLLQALADAKFCKDNFDSLLAGDVILFFTSTYRGPGSFEWICDVCEINAQKIKTAMEKKFLFFLEKKYSNCVEGKTQL